MVVEQQRAALADAQDTAAAAGASDTESPEGRYVYVKAAPALGERMALWDRNAAHPDGEVKVYGQDQMPVKVAADAPEVITALAQKRIVILEGRPLERARAQADRARQSRVAEHERELDRRRTAAEAAAPGSDAGVQAQLAQLRAQVAAAQTAPAGDDALRQELDQLRAELAQVRAVAESAPATPPPADVSPATPQDTAAADTAAPKGGKGA